MPAQETESTIRQQVLGRRLSGVNFVMDYIQLQFDPPPTINALTPVTVRSGGKQAIQGEEPFRNLLCDQISKTVTSVDLQHEETLTLAFADGSEISLSLRPSDYVGLEAVNVCGKNHLYLVM